MPQRLRTVTISQTGRITVGQAHVDGNLVVLTENGVPSSSAKTTDWEVEFKGLDPSDPNQGEVIFRSANKKGGGVTEVTIKGEWLTTQNESLKYDIVVNGTPQGTIFDVYDAYRNLP